MASSASFSRKVWHWLPSLLVWRITDIPATCTSLSVFLVLTLPSCNICLFPSSLYLLIYLLFCLHLPLFLSLLFSSLTSMINWMVFDYYMAVRLTAINWIESQSISFTSLSLPCLCLSHSRSSFHLTLIFLLVCHVLCFFYSLGPSLPLFLLLALFPISVSFSLFIAAPSCSRFLSLSFLLFFSSPCPPFFSLSSRFLRSLPPHVPLLASFHPFFPSYSLSLCFPSLIYLSLLPPSPFSLPGSLSPSALWYCCHGDAHHFLAWMEDTLLMRRHGRERKRERDRDGEKDKDGRKEREKPLAEKIRMIWKWLSPLLTRQNNSTL